MSTRSNRRRSARNRDAQTPSDDEHPQTNGGSVTMNGNGSVHAPSIDSDSSEERENIFLFWPNLIGRSSALRSTVPLLLAVLAAY